MVGSSGSSGNVMRDASLRDGEAAACRAMPLPCLDASVANVLEVPAAMTAAQAFQNAKTNDIIQVRGVRLGGGRVPAGVTLHGCEGAVLAGPMGVSGTGATIEGFEIPTNIVLNQTGTYVIRWNRFTAASADGGTPTSGPAVSARSIDALVSATVTTTIEQNVFEGRSAGIEAATRYDTMVHTVLLTARNNVFQDVNAPIVISRGGIVGKITASIAHNTFYGFGDAIRLSTLNEQPTIAGNVFAEGTNAVQGSYPLTIGSIDVQAIDIA
jgi:hypothetical protein